MALPGIDPSSPIPSTLRNYSFGVGPAGAAGSTYPVYLYGNKESGGTATLDEVAPEPVASDEDAILAVGGRSELYAMYSSFVAINPDAPIYLVPVTEVSGTAASRVITVANDATANTDVLIEWLGQQATYSISTGDGEQDTSDGLAAAINAMNQGRMPGAAVSAVVSMSTDYTCTITFTHDGDRGDYALSDKCLKLTLTTKTGTQSQTLTLASVSASSGTDDHSSAIADAANAEQGIHVTPKTATSAPSTTDNGLGELMLMIKTQAQPINGKDQHVFYGTVGTPAQANAVASASAVNSVYAHGIQQEGAKWLPSMVAAWGAALARKEVLAHPALKGINGAVANDSLPLTPPVPFARADHPTRIEVTSMLNNGVTPLAVEGTRTKLVRFITTRSLNDESENDYRARPGHIPWVAHFYWLQAAARWDAIKQPFAAADPTNDQPAPADTSTPSQIVAMLAGLTRELASSNPLGRFEGPILAPDYLDEMIEAIVVNYDGAGRFYPTTDIRAVQKTITYAQQINEVSVAS